MWSDFNSQEARHTHTTVATVKSHIGYSQVSAGKLSLEDYVGNNLADIAASLAAEQARAPEMYANEAAKKEAEATLIAQRLACIEVWHREHIPALVLPFAPPARSM